MSKPITIIHEKCAEFFGKSQRLSYEGAIFSNGKVAFVDEHGQILASNSKKDLLTELNKRGKASIAPVAEPAKSEKPKKGHKR